MRVYTQKNIGVPFPYTIAARMNYEYVDCSITTQILFHGDQNLL